MTGQGASIDTNIANGRLMFAFFAALAEFKRELIVERTQAGLAAARARGRNGGRPFKMTAASLLLAQAAMGKPETSIAEVCAELGVTPARHPRRPAAMRACTIEPPQTRVGRRDWALQGFSLFRMRIDIGDKARQPAST